MFSKAGSLKGDIEAVVDVVCGKCTTEEYIERVRRDFICP
jgi:hypothetical protein